MATKQEIADELRTQHGIDVDPEATSHEDLEARLREARAGASSGDQSDAREDAGIATPEQNASLKHSVELDAERTPGDAEEGARTTRMDPLDQGVPMLQGDPNEPQGPEDAFGEGAKRGDYSQRTGGVQSFEARPNPSGGKAITDEDGNVLDYEPHTIMVPQVPNASVQGEVPGEKGGVTTGDAGDTTRTVVV